MGQQIYTCASAQWGMYILLMYNKNSAESWNLRWGIIP